MTLITLTAADLHDLEQGKILTRVGGPTIRIVYGPAREIDVVKKLTEDMPQVGSDRPGSEATKSL